MTGVFRDDVPIVLELEGLEVRAGALGGGMSVAFVHLLAGEDLGPALEWLRSSPARPHWGYLLRGQLSVTNGEAPELLEAGQALHLAPGRVAEAIEESELVAFSPAPAGVTGALQGSRTLAMSTTQRST